MISPQSISEVLKRNFIKINGVLHIGAYECEELVHYSYLGIPKENVIWIEASQEKVDEAIRRGIPNVYQAVISDKDNEPIEFNVADNGQSSSILEPKMHLIHYPHIHFTKKISLVSTKLDTFLLRNNLDSSKYDFWNFDIQGAEMLALRGGLNTLVNYPPKVIYLEVNTEEIYKGCSLLEEIDEFLLALGYKRETTAMSDCGWGDAMYIRVVNPIESPEFIMPVELIKIYYVNNWWHPKNIGGLLQLMLRYNNVQVKEWNNEDDGIIFSPSIKTDIIKHYKKVISGPHMGLQLLMTLSNTYKGKKIYYNALSKWCKKLHESNAPNENIEYIALPFPVDVDKFLPSEKENKYFVYSKLVHSSRMSEMINYLDSLNLKMEYKIFTYGSYREEDYLNWIKRAKFGIWVGCHESQGFAFQESLSCGCPLFVYDVTSLKDECDSYNVHPWANFQGETNMATSASYFNETCGIIYKDNENLQEKFQMFMEKLPSFRPREFVIDNLSESKFIKNILSLNFSV